MVWKVPSSAGAIQSACRLEATEEIILQESQWLSPFAWPSQGRGYNPVLVIPYEVRLMHLEVLI